MARIICMLRSMAASARREKPTSVPRTKPMLPPIKKPMAARARLVPRSRSSDPFSASCHAVFITLLGAGSTCGESQPQRASVSQTMTSATGASQEMTVRLCGPSSERVVARTGRAAEREGASACARRWPALTAGADRLDAGSIVLK